MITVNARSTAFPGAPFEATTIQRRNLRSHDVLIDVAYAGICHSDIHTARGEWGQTHFPLVPGHEIAGTVSAVGWDVAKFAVGDRVGVGCMVDSCRECEHCLAGEEQYCLQGSVWTYDGIGKDGRPTDGGYSEKIVVDDDYILRIPEGISLDVAAPLLCAGITVYSPLRRWGAGLGKHVAIGGLGGLGHMGVKIAKAMGAEVTVLSQSMKKQEDGLRLGADHYHATGDDATFARLAHSCDLIVSTLSATVDIGAYLSLLKLDGAMVNLGAPAEPLSVPAFALISGRRSLAGSLIGGIRETQEMLDFCAEHDLGAEVEVISADQIDEAYNRVIASDVRYRFVIDIATMAS
jgi:alcohol dehydrogenase (NADP+)